MSDKAAPATEADTSVAPQENTNFGDDDLGRLQGILFGDHARRTTERIDTLEQALLGAIADLQTTVTDEIKALNKRLDSEQDTRTKALTNLTERVKKGAKDQGAEVKALQRTLDASAATLTEQVQDVALLARAETEQARDELARELDAQTASLRESSVNRQTLADLLTETAAELRS